MTAKNGTGGLFQTGMIADSRLVMEVVLKEHSSVFQGVSSLVDAGGGHGAAAASIAKVLPHVKCTVLDLPHVVAGAPISGNVHFVAGDVFEYIPPADAVLLKVHT
jgi:methylase of polypeptide subunit release factors